jgi:hypothetical protein
MAPRNCAPPNTLSTLADAPLNAEGLVVTQVDRPTATRTAVSLASSSSVTLDGYMSRRQSEGRVIAPPTGSAAHSPALPPRPWSTAGGSNVPHGESSSTLMSESQLYGTLATWSPPLLVPNITYDYPAPITERTTQSAWNRGSPAMIADTLTSSIAMTRPRKPVVPPRFKFLVQRLRHYVSQGIARPLRVRIATDISTDRHFYSTVGFANFKALVEAAEKEGIVMIGGEGEKQAWISLK